MHSQDFLPLGSFVLTSLFVVWFFKIGWIFAIKRNKNPWLLGVVAAVLSPVVLWFFLPRPQKVEDKSFDRQFRQIMLVSLVISCGYAILLYTQKIPNDVFR